jgi:uncharacterized protein (TIGR00730 family)
LQFFRQFFTSKKTKKWNLKFFSTTKKVSKQAPKEDHSNLYNQNSQNAEALLRGEVIHPADFRSGMATWRIFRIMSEFVEGYDFLADLNADVTVFGSARTKPGSKYYEMATDLTYMMAKAGYAVVTGGGPGIMEAANKGANLGGGESIGLNIQLPFEQRINKYVKHGMGFHFFFTRKVMLTSPSQAFVAFPGGFGTIDEVMEVLTLMQTHKMQPVPMILVGGKFWGALRKFIEEQMLKEHNAIRETDMDLFHIVDSAAEAMKILKKYVVVDQLKSKRRPA